MKKNNGEWKSGKSVDISTFLFQKNVNSQFTSFFNKKKIYRVKFSFKFMWLKIDDIAAETGLISSWEI